MCCCRSPEEVGHEGGSGILGLVGDCWNSGKEKQNYCKMESVGFDKRMFLIKGKNVLFL